MLIRQKKVVNIWFQVQSLPSWLWEHNIHQFCVGNTTSKVNGDDDNYDDDCEDDYDDDCDYCESTIYTSYVSATPLRRSMNKDDDVVVDDGVDDCD